jgi:hypothetical protein
MVSYEEFLTELEWPSDNGNINGMTELRSSLTPREESIIPLAFTDSAVTFRKSISQFLKTCC